MDNQLKEKIHDLGKSLEPYIEDFYGRISLNFANGKYVNSNIEISLKPSSTNKSSRRIQGCA